MKRTLSLALVSIMSTVVFAPLANAQDNFPDVAENHWAYEALEVLKREGILVGYPDGLYRGARNATRYELAAAVYQAYKRMKGLSDGISEQISELQKALGGDSGADLKELRDQLAALKAAADGVGKWGEEIAAMKKLTSEFEKELASLGVDVEALKKDLADLEGRVTTLENNTVKGKIAISGDANIYVAAGNSRDGFAGLTKDGRLVGINNIGDPVGLTQDANVFHEIALNLASTNTKGPSWYATLVYGNLLDPFAGGATPTVGTPAAYSTTTRFPGAGIGEASTSFYVDKFVVDLGGSVANLPFNAKVGRLGLKVSPYIFQRVDTTPYFTNSRWDDGEFRVDGAHAAFNFGSVELGVFAGKNSTQAASNGGNIGLIQKGDFQVDATLGATLGVKLGNNISGKLAYLIHDTEAPTASVDPNRLSVFGGEGTAKFGNFTINGGYSKSILTHNTSNLGLDNNNQAAFASVGFANGDSWGLSAEYRKIQANYLAAGSWRRLGTNWSPTNLETFSGMGFLTFSKFRLDGYGEFGETISAAGGAPRDSKIEAYKGKLSYELSDAWKTYVSYEEFKLKNPGSFGGGNLVRQRWATVGFGTKLGESAGLDLAYEYGSAQNGIAWGTGPAGGYAGGFLTTQLSIKF